MIGFIFLAFYSNSHSRYLSWLTDWFHIEGSREGKTNIDFRRNKRLSLNLYVEIKRRHETKQKLLQYANQDFNDM
ncbi:hypothetical protein BLOT_008144 [Blomia tropicalis]|nr:hypothetical protein BLOT_008144 [Blomia tropicalis]